MTIRELAQTVAHEFLEAVADDGFESFEEMCRINDYTAKDIRNEISYMAQDAINNAYEVYLYEHNCETAPFGLFPSVMDDGAVQDDKQYLHYRDFKKLVFSEMKGCAK